ncbi:hypothetical protein PFMG_01216 [Plasmodium falciparum IGH-CR14]|uniref:Uncharacterized protein n=1 Tax=Plasmodium falciparum IGH-CR14 TaxID=580059 RepID=A0A0L1I5U6_PLAFA|nr:hypothetical protein PFMG_01216 [Plasmodium falciparum IGH-CR14]
MKEGNVQNYILFEGENDVKSDRFCYDYSNPSPIKKTTKHFTSYKTQMNNDGLFKRASLKQNEFKYDIMNNINNYITNSHDTRRHSIPMLWIHDNKTVYSM